MVSNVSPLFTYFTLQSPTIDIDTAQIKAGRAAFLYNYMSYAWQAFRISSRNVIDSKNVYVVLSGDLNVGGGWQPYLVTPPCLSYNFYQSTNPYESVCDIYGKYQKSNTVFVVGDVIEYELLETPFIER